MIKMYLKEIISQRHYCIRTLLCTPMYTSDQILKTKQLNLFDQAIYLLYVYPGLQKYGRPVAITDLFI